MMCSWKKMCTYIAIGCVIASVGLVCGYKYILEEFSKTGGLILEYHSISRHNWEPSLVIAPEVFEQHLKLLKNNNYKIVTVAELTERLRAGESADHYVALSFDDGYKDNYTTVLPLLQKYNAKGTFSIIPRMIGKEIYMNDEEIRKMISAGMEIGSHTNSHNPLAIIDPKYLEWEIGASKTILEKRFPIIIKTLAYPNGSYDKNVIEAMKRYGYEQALTGNTGYTDKEFCDKRPMELNRVIIMDDGKGPDYFRGLLKRAYRRSLFLKIGIDLGD